MQSKPEFFWDALIINLAKAGNKSGCKLVSGSFRTKSEWGRGVNNAAPNNKYLNVPSDNSGSLSGRRSPY